MRTLPIVALLASLNAWAVGEHIAVTGPAKDQMSETLCISMECGKGHDYTVASKLVGEQMELKVLSPDGSVRFTLKTPVNANGRIGASDAMTATAQLVHAIENPAPEKAAAVEKPARAKVAAAKHKVHAPVRVAARMRSRG